MPDILKQTLYWSADPSETVTDDGGTGGSVARSITAAESHDASDSTYLEVGVTGDGLGNDGNVYADLSALLQTASVSGSISFVRVKMRGRVTGAGGVGTVNAIIDGTQPASPSALTGSFANYTQDFSTDPSDSSAWTNAKVNAKQWGVSANSSQSDANSPAVSIVRMSEFEVQIWGPASVLTSSPATVMSKLRAAVTHALGGTADAYASPPDPSVAVPLRTKVDAGFVPVTIRSFLSSLADGSTGTKQTFTSPASWPSSGTRLEPLYGAASQGLVGSAGGGNGINGEGLISGVRLCAMVRVAKSASSSITNIRFGTTMGTKNLLVQPTIRDYDAALTEGMWEVVQTDIITTGQFGNPFTWGNGTDSVWASLFGWTFNHTYSNPTNPGRTQVEVAEAWVEVLGPTGGVVADPFKVTLNAGPLIVVAGSEL